MIMFILFVVKVSIKNIIDFKNKEDALNFIESIQGIKKRYILL
ncbi:hypothetical protein [Clostridium sp. Marseille-Q7071]